MNYHQLGVLGMCTSRDTFWSIARFLEMADAFLRNVSQTNSGISDSVSCESNAFATQLLLSEPLDPVRLNVILEHAEHLA